MRRLPTLRGERVALRPLREDDVDWLSGVIGAKEVARWWGPRAHDREHVRAGLLEDVAEGAAFAIEVDSALAGWLGTISSRSIRPPATCARSRRAPRSGPKRSASCASTSAGRTGSGATACSWTCWRGS